MFWNREIGEIHLESTDMMDVEFFEQNLHRICVQNKIEEPDDEEVPIIYGHFTNWLPQKMTDIRDFCHSVNSDKTDILELCKAQNLIADER